MHVRIELDELEFEKSTAMCNTEQSRDSPLDDCNSVQLEWLSLIYN